MPGAMQRFRMPHVRMLAAMEAAPSRRMQSLAAGCAGCRSKRLAGFAALYRMTSTGLRKGSMALLSSQPFAEWQPKMTFVCRLATRSTIR